VKLEQQRQSHQAATNLLLADVDSQCKAAIRWLFDASIMLKDSVSRFCWRLKMVSMQVSVLVLALAVTYDFIYPNSQLELRERLHV
jgi:hypothetical protein